MVKVQYGLIDSDIYPPKKTPNIEALAKGLLFLYSVSVLNGTENITKSLNKCMTMIKSVNWA